MNLLFEISVPVICAVLLTAGLLLHIIRRPKRSAKLFVIALAAVIIYCIIGAIHYTH